MKHCRICDVNVNQKHANCPLCGAYLDQDGVGQEHYVREIEGNVNNYGIEYRDIVRRNFWSKRVLSWCMILIGICVLINVLASPTSLWSGYVAVGVLVSYFAVINNIFKRKRFYAILANGAIYLSMAIVLIDVLHSYDTVMNMSAFGFSIKYVVPGILVGIIIACDVLIGKGDTKCTYYLLTSFLTCVLALMPQIAAWAFFPEWQDTWAMLSAMGFAVLNCIVVATVHSKDIASEIKRKFNMR